MDAGALVQAACPSDVQRAQLPDGRTGLPPKEGRECGASISANLVSS